MSTRSPEVVRRPPQEPTGACNEPPQGASHGSLCTARRTPLTSTLWFALKTIFEQVCADFDAVVVEFNGEGDLVHLLVNYPPKVALSGLVNSVKGVSSRIMRRDHPRTGQPVLAGPPVVTQLLRRFRGRRPHRRAA